MPAFNHFFVVEYFWRHGQYMMFIKLLFVVSLLSLCRFSHIGRFCLTAAVTFFYLQFGDTTWAKCDKISELADEYMFALKQAGRQAAVTTRIIFSGSAFIQQPLTLIIIMMMLIRWMTTIIIRRLSRWWAYAQLKWTGARRCQYCARSARFILKPAMRRIN